MIADERDLRAYALHRDENAFRQIVARHAPMVHGVALRMTGDHGLAEEITQTVFCILARKAAQVRHPAIRGWLHNAATAECRNARRKESRRHRLLNEYSEMMNTESTADAGLWAGLRPQLDDAIASLPAEDREIMILRFFEQRSFREISAETGRTEESCRQKCKRALERLEKVLTRRKALPAGTALGSLLASQVLCSPPASAALIATTALQSTSLAGASFLAKILLQMTSQQLMKTAALVAILTAIPAAIYLKPEPLPLLPARTVTPSTASGTAADADVSGESPGSAGSRIDWQTIASRFGEGNGLTGMIAARKLEARLRELSAEELATGLEAVTESGIDTGAMMRLRHSIAHILAPLDPMAVLNRFPSDGARDMGVNLSVGLLELAKKDPGAADAWFADQMKAGNFDRTYPDGSPQYLGYFQGAILSAAREKDPADYGRRILAMPADQRGEAIRWSAEGNFKTVAETVTRTGDPAVMLALLDSEFTETTLTSNNTHGKSNVAILGLLDSLPDNEETSRIREKLEAAANRKFKTDRY